MNIHYFQIAPRYISIGETEIQLTNEPRFQINHGGNHFIYGHFDQPGHHILSMKVQIKEKLYHPDINPQLSTPSRRKREEHSVRQLGTAAPYSCNGHIDSI